MQPREEVEAHIREFFEGHIASKTEWLKGPTAKLWPHLRYLIIAPGPLYQGWVSGLRPPGASNLMPNVGALCQR